MKILTLSLPAILMIPLVGCSSGSSGPARIELCSRYKRLIGADHPLPMEKGSELSKTVLKPDEPVVLQPGEYSYNGSKFYFRDQERDIELLVAQNVNENEPEGDKPVALCIGGRGINKDMKPVTYEIPVVSHMSVDENGKTMLTTKIISFDIRPREDEAPLQMFVTSGTSGVEGSLKDVYQQYDTVEQGIYTYDGDIINTRAKISEAVAPSKSLDDTPLLELRTEVAYKFKAPEKPVDEAADEAAGESTAN